MTSTSEQTNQSPKTKKYSSMIIRSSNGVDGPNGSGSGLLKTKSNELETKPSGSPFKIRIPVRTQLKPPAPVVPSTTDTAKALDPDVSGSSSSSLKSLPKPRRSLRRQASVASSGEQSLSSVSTFLRDNC